MSESGGYLFLLLFTVDKQSRKSYEQRTKSKKCFVSNHEQQRCISTTPSLINSEGAKKSPSVRRSNRHRNDIPLGLSTKNSISQISFFVKPKTDFKRLPLFFNHMSQHTYPRINLQSRQENHRPHQCKEINSNSSFQRV